MSSSGTQISAVVPVYQECEVINHTAERLSAVLAGIGINYEIIFIDDGSQDGTFSAIEQLHRQDPRIRGIRLSTHCGKEAALHAGLIRASGAAIVTIDGDLQHPPELIPQMVQAWREGAKIVNGVKQPSANEPFIYRLATGLFYRLLLRVGGFDLRRSSDFKLLDRQMVALYLQNFHERQRFFRGLVTTMGFAQANIEFAVQPRKKGKSRWSYWQLTRYGMRAISAFSSMPLYIMPLLSMTMLVIAFVLGAEALISRLEGKSVSGFATLEITLLFIGSLVMIGMSVIGQYVARIYEEIKQRPMFFVEKETGF